MDVTLDKRGDSQLSFGMKKTTQKGGPKNSSTKAIMALVVHTN